MKGGTLTITPYGVIDDNQGGRLLTTLNQIQKAYPYMPGEEASSVFRQYMEAKAAEAAVAAAEAAPAGEAAPEPASASAPAAEAGEESLEQVVKINDIINLIDSKVIELKTEIMKKKIKT